MATVVSSVFSLHTMHKAQRPAVLSCPKSSSTVKFPRLGISHAKRKVFPLVISCLFEDDGPSGSNGVSIDLKLPRRSLLLHFTCNSCGERSKKLINRLAYEKGTVFVQCKGCLQHHKLVDNLNLVVEYDLREEININSQE